MGALLPICCYWKPCRELGGRALPPESAWELLIWSGCCSGSCQTNPAGRSLLPAQSCLPAIQGLGIPLAELAHWCSPAWPPTHKHMAWTFLNTTWTSCFLSWAVFGVMSYPKAQSGLGIYFYFPFSGSFAVSWVVPIPSAQLELLAKGLREWEDVGVGFMHVPQPRPVSVSWPLPCHGWELSLACLRSC